MRTWLAILLFLMSCSKQEVPSVWYVSGRITPEENLNTVAVWDGQNPAKPWSEIQASAVLEGGGQAFSMEKTETGFDAPTDAHLLHGTSYTLTCTLGDQSLRAFFRIPAAIVPMDTSTLTIGAQDQPAWIQWTMTDSEDYAYLYSLRPVASNGIDSPLAGPRFDERFQGPQRSNGLDIRPDDFRYQGLHELVVYAIPIAFESIYFNSFSDLRGLVQLGPDQVDGGMGFILGISEARWKINFIP